MNCLIYTNCERGLIYEFLKLSTDFNREFQVDLDKIPPNHIAIQNNIVIPDEILKKVKLFIYQPLDKKYNECSTEYILSKLPSDCFCISLPRLYFRGYWPEHSVNPYNQVKQNVLSNLFPYGDNNLNEMLKQKLPTFTILDEVSRIDFYDKNVLLDNLNNSIQEFNNKEKQTDIKISNYILNHYSHQQLFHTVNHPTDIIGLEVANQILKILNMPILAEETKPVKREVLGGTQVPIYPSVIEQLNLTFVSTNSLYRSKGLGKMVTFSEYVEEYLYQDSEYNQKCWFVMTNTTDHIKSAEDYYKLGLDLRKQGDLEKAIWSFTQALHLKNDYNWVHFDLANVLMLQGKFPEAVASYKNAISSSGNRTNGLFYMRLGEAYAKQGLLNEAVDNYQNAIAIDSFPLKPTVLSRLADIFVSQEKYDQAIDAYEQAINASDDFLCPLVMFRLGDLAHRQGSEQKALDYYKQAIKLNSVASKPIFYLMPGKNLIQKNRLDLAVLFYESMLRINPDSYQARYQLAMVQFKLGQYEEAISSALQALEINPTFIEAQRGLTEICKAFGLRDIAVSISSGILPLDLIEKYFLKDHSKQSSLICDISTSTDVKITNVYDREYVAFSPSKTVTSSIPSKFLVEGGYIRKSYVAKIPDGRAYSNFWTSAVLTPNNQLVTEVSTGFSSLISVSRRLPELHSFFGKAAFLSSRLGSRCYFHWMLDVFPRVELLRLSGIELEEIDYFLFYQPDRKFCNESLNRLNIPKEKVVDSVAYPHIKATELLVPSLPSGYRGSFWVIDFLKRTFLPEGDYPPTERIFISRQNAGGRRIINESEVMEILSKYGFKLVFLESMSVVEQAKLMASAQVIISPHGSGLTNIVFCQPGTKIIELFSSAYINECYWTLSNQCSLKHYHWISNASLKSEKIISPLGAVDFFVDSSELLKLLGIVGL